MHGDVPRHRRHGDADEAVLRRTIWPEAQEPHGVIAHLDEMDVRRPVPLERGRDLAGNLDARVGQATRNPHGMPSDNTHFTYLALTWNGPRRIFPSIFVMSVSGRPALTSARFISCFFFIVS